MKHSLLSLACWVLLSAQAFAQVAITSRRAEPGFTLEEAVRRSLRFNPEIAKLDRDLADKLGRAIETGVKLNPSFKFTAGRIEEGDREGSAFEFEIEQPVRPSDFGLRKTYASALRVTADVQQQAEILRLLNGTAMTFYRAWSLQERASLLDSARGQAGDALAMIQQQLEAGQSNISQRNIFEAEAARFSAELLAVRGESAGAMAELERATGTRLTGIALVRPTFPAVPGTGALTAFAENRAGIRRIALAQRNAAARGLAVAEADAVFPEFGPGILASRSNHNDETGVAFTLIGRIPLWDRNQGEIVRARGALDAAERELQSFDRVSLERSISLRRQQLLNLQARASAYRDQVIPAYRAAYDSTLEQFRAGQASTLLLFEVQRSLVDAQEKSFEYAVEALSARTQLEQLIGGRLEEVSK
ncbi:MAG TPA: TolC family protein [Chthoniobacterales bacterium]|nr:TolC family protein [Chthoniobacterales bacterium]